MYKKLKDLQKNAYCKYSNFKVASIAVCSDKQYIGVNVENAAFGDTICAERNAISNAIANGETKIDQIHLLTDSNDCNLGTPCGSCRQVMSEFMDANAKVYVYDQKQNVKVFELKDLLPYSFNLKN